MACLIERKVVNPRYKKIHPENHFLLFGDRDDYYIPVDCGVCVNCVNKYKSTWYFRLVKEFEYYTLEQLQRSYYVTLTMSPEYYSESKQETSKLFRRFLERVRKHTRKSVRHFFISERGEYDNGQHRIHFHGFLFDINFNPNKIWSFWNYGFIKVKPCINSEETLLDFIGYCAGYITKEVTECIIDKFDKPYVFVSPGLGKAYSDDPQNISFHHQNKQFIPFILENKSMRSLPRYLRNKIFSEDELLQMKNEYFKNQSDDLLPPPPYFIGKQQFDDYTNYQRALKEIKQQYDKKYGNKSCKTIYGLAESESPSCELG